VWQLHYLYINVVRRVRYPIMECQHFVNAGCACHQIKQAGLRPYIDVPRDCPQWTGKPDKLNRIAQPVIAANENALADKRLAHPNMLQMAWLAPPVLA
jgi:hypothetical protein